MRQRCKLAKNMGKIESQPMLSGNRWKEVRKDGDRAIKKWIDEQMYGKTCLVVPALVGEHTASRPWVRHEIERTWDEGLGVVGIRIHGLKNLQGGTAARGKNPFGNFSVDGQILSSIVTLHDPWRWDSKAVYADISENLEALVEKDLVIRGD